MVHVGSDSFLIGAVPDYAADPTLCFSAKDDPTQMQFAVGWGGAGLEVQALRVTFEGAVAPEIFVKQGTAGAPPGQWITEEVFNFPPGF